MNFLRVLGSFQIGAGCFGGFVPELSNFLFFYLFLYQKKKKMQGYITEFFFLLVWTFCIFFLNFDGLH